VVIAEARRLFTALSLYGFTVEAAMVNRVLPPNAGGEFLRRQREAQRDALVQVAESFEGMTIRHAPMIPGEPVGVQPLSAFATVVFGDADPLESTGHSIGIDVEGADGQYQLALPLPLVQRGDLKLSRSADDLVVTVGDVRRRISLPSVLRRCTVSGARFDHGRLLIEFDADPGQWPQSLRESVLSEVTEPMMGTA
jgi:arsenite-transporting ATPase